VLAGAEGVGGVDLDRDRAGPRRRTPVRAVNEKPPDPQGREGAAGCFEPIARLDRGFGDIEQRTAGRRDRQCDRDLLLRIEATETRIGFNAPDAAVLGGLERREGLGPAIENARGCGGCLGAGDQRGYAEQARPLMPA
jgi:hypothetical protein